MVSNFQQLIACCTQYGPQYNPAHPRLKLPALIALHTQARNALNQVYAAKAAYNVAINNRRIIFARMKKLVLRIFSLLRSLGVSPLTLADARGIINKIQGRRKTPLVPGTGISSAQLSYSSLIDHFETFLQLVSLQPYNPNEIQFQLSSLYQFLQQMKDANTQVITTKANWSRSLSNRDHVLYQPLTGIVPTALATRCYILSLFGGTSPYFIQARSIPFEDLSR